MTADPAARGDIWLVDFGVDRQDPEQAFVRPAAVVSDDRLHHPNLGVVIVVPGTTTLRGLPMHVVVEPDSGNGLDRPTAFQAEQVRAVSNRRLVSRLGDLAAESRYELDNLLRAVLRL